MLKYVVLSEILAKSDSDFLSGKEASVYKDDFEIIKVNQLKSAVAINEIETIMSIIQDRQLNLMMDPLFKAHKDDLLRSVYLQALEKKCRPYNKVKLSFLASEMKLSETEIRSLLSELILEDRIRGQID
jgi:COP9 signalosome complex subunit 2